VTTCPSGHASASDDYCDVCGAPIGAAPTFAPGGAPAAPAAPAGPAGPGATAVTVPGTGSACPDCGSPRAGNFCESCGHDFTAVGPDTLDPAVYRSAPPLTGPYPPLPGRVPPPAPGQAPAPVPVPRPEPAPVPRPEPAPAPRPEQAPAGPEWTAVVTADRAYFEAVQAAGGPDAAGIVFPAYSPQRRFRLAGDEVRIGRHSASSGIDPEIDLSVPPADPGVSRLHAVLLRSPDDGWSVVDPGSVNGTAVNGSEIPRGQPVPLRDGDRIHLGAWTELRVVRGG
jgi:hypothetical protein